MLEVKNLSVFYDDFQALKNIRLNVKEGELVGLFGLNGHGKSTLLKTICGLINPKEGTILFKGVDISMLPVEKKVELGIVYIAEERNLFTEMSVLDNLKLGSYCRRARNKQKENLKYVFDLFPKLKKMENRTSSSLSGGEARMLAIGRGLMSSADFLAIDEPSLGLAPNIRSEVFKKISAINKEGASILLVEQSIANEITDICDRIYIIEDGKIVVGGEREKVLNETNIKEIFFGENAIP